jgi:ubiquinone/menaquinone biosynthesis C-methylase UbiE
MSQTLEFSRALAAVLLCAGAGFAQAPRTVAPQKLAPFVTSPQPIIDRMLELAGLKPGEVLYDLGCGDGRILVSAVKKFGAKAVGVEMSEPLVKQATNNIHSQGIQDQARIIQADMMGVDVSAAQVVTLYLLTDANDLLKPKLEKELKPGARVVSLEFKVRGWKPARVDKVEAHHRPYTVYLYEMPQKP